MRILLLLSLITASLLAQETRNSAAAEGVRGVNQEGTATVKNVDPRTTAVNAEKVKGVEKVEGVKAAGAKGATPPPPPPPTPHQAKGVEKVEGLNKVEGVKALGTKAVTPPPPPPPAPREAKGVEKVEGIKGVGTKAVTPPPEAKGVKKIEGVKGVGTKAVPPPPAPKAVAPPPTGSAVKITPGKIGTGGTIKAVDGVKGLQTEKLKNLEAALQIKEKPEHKGGGKAKAAAELITQPGPLPQPGNKEDGRTLFPEQKIPNTGS